MNAKRVTNFIVSWLEDYVQKANVKGFVLGISGGIDSAVTSTLCAKTKFPTLCVQMPIHQDIDQVSRAQEHIELLQKTYKNVMKEQVDLTPTFECFQESFKPFDTSTKDLTLANTKARMRMVGLYYLAGMYQFLVVGTGNKVEDFGVGFYTKYGDGGVDISPIADLVKSEVFTLGAYLNVSKNILNAAPTDGLFSDQRTDEQQIGASYDELEWAMNFVENSQNTTENLAQDLTQRQRQILNIYKYLNKANQHKMQPIPVCVVPKEIKEN